MRNITRRRDVNLIGKHFKYATCGQRQNEARQPLYLWKYINSPDGSERNRECDNALLLCSEGAPSAEGELH